MTIDILIMIPLMLIFIAVGFMIGRSGAVRKHDRNDKYEGGFDPQHDHHFDPKAKYHDEKKRK